MVALTLNAKSQSFRKGDMVADFGVGVGISQLTPNELVSDNTTKMIFSQKISFEVGILNFGDKSSLGFGVSLNNACGAAHENVISGSYDYSYTISRYHYIQNKGGRYLWELYDRDVANRKGIGSAKAKTIVNDFNVMLKIAYHREIINKLDTYVSIGFGMSGYKYFYSNYTDLNGFSSKSSVFDSKRKDISYQSSYSYDDLSHVEWQQGAMQGRFAIGAYIGARYYITDHWGVNVETGLVSVSLKKDLNDFNIISVGTSYKF